MRKLGALLVAVGLSASSTLGAEVTFSPNPGGSDTVSVLSLPATVNFDVSIGLGTSSMQSTDMIFGTSGLTLDGFTYNPEITTPSGRTVVAPILPGPIGLYPTDLYVNAAFAIPTAINGLPALPTGNFLFGTLAVGVPANTPVGDYTVFVDVDQDGTSFVGFPDETTDGLKGIGTVHVVVPEPATLGLLALGALGLIRRRLA